MAANFVASLEEAMRHQLLEPEFVRSVHVCADTSWGAHHAIKQMSVARRILLPIAGEREVFPRCLR
jgi:hypothetical protein